MKIKKIILSVFLVLAVAAYAIYQRLGGSAKPVILPKNPEVPSNTPENTEIDADDAEYSNTSTTSTVNNTDNTKTNTNTNANTKNNTNSTNNTNSNTATNTTATSNTNNTNTTNTNTANNQNSQALYKDGEYLGDSIDALYGKVQLSVIVKGGNITDIKFLDYPKDDLNSKSISNQSLPTLKTEAIAAQSAKIDIVSGATETSDAFKKSLASALVKAKV